jgi:hypothetical protein
MAKYTIRVELEGSPTREEYDSLHLKMKNLGFLQTVPGVQDGQSVTVKLPTGLYYGESVYIPSKVCSDVYAAAKSIRKVIGVFTAQTATWSSQP